jgi:hypothetical protein
MPRPVVPIMRLPRKRSVTLSSVRWYCDLLVKVFNRRAITVDEIVDDLLGYVERLRPMVCDSTFWRRMFSSKRSWMRMPTRLILSA